MNSISSAKRSVNSLPEDLILEVFLRLPRKSLVRSRCVSKGLLNLMDRQSFKKRYDTFHNSVSDFAVICIECPYRPLSMDFHLPDNLDSSIEKEVNIPLDGNYSFFVGGCKGIVCLIVSPDILFMAFPESENYILFNPFNGTFQKVGGYNLEPLNCDFTVGFGYDYATNDYKIVRFQPSDVPCVYVYSMQRDSWRQVIVEFNPGYTSDDYGIFVDGAIHWLWLEDLKVYSYIVAFDLETESVRSVPLPKFETGRLWSSNNFGGRLCVCVKSPDDSTIVWVMEEYGVETSWTPLFTIADRTKLFGYFPTWDNARLLCFGSDSRSLLWLNTQDGSKKSIQIHMVPRQQGTWKAMLFGKISVPSVDYTCKYIDLFGFLVFALSQFIRFLHPSSLAFT